MRNAAVKYDVSEAQTAARRGPLSALALRRWLHGRWALLFSHPDDFAAYGFESDRWLVHVHEAFAATDIRPLARAGDREPGWVTEVGGCTTSFAPEALDRFVLTLDATLRVRRTLVYTKADRLPSPMDLALVAKDLREGLRNRHAAVRSTPAILCRR